MKKILFLLVLVVTFSLMAKGTCLPSEGGKPTSAILDLSNLRVVESHTDETKADLNNGLKERDWQTVKTEGFEGAWPNEWNCYSSNNVDCYWGDNLARSSEGAWSGWCADDGSDSPSTQEYAEDMHSWMVYGPFSLADADDAKLTYDIWYRTESSYDYIKVMASIDGTQFWGRYWSGDSEGWINNREFDLTEVYQIGNLTGLNQVWIAFIFTSDGSVNFEGAYIDEVEISKDYDPPTYYGAPDIYSVTLEEGTDSNSNGYYEEVWLDVDVDAVSTGRATYRAENCYISIYVASTNEFVGEWGPFSFDDTATTDNVILGPISNAVDFATEVTLNLECTNEYATDYHSFEVNMEPNNTDSDVDMITNATSLISNYPNPFNPQTSINYNLAENCQASLNVYNVKGELVTTLINSQQTAGNHTVIWDGNDKFGKRAASGIYYYKLVTPDYSAIRRMIMLK